MKRYITIACAVLALGVVGWTVRAQIGSQNVVSGWDGAVTIANRVHINSAATGSAVSLAGRIGSGLVAVVGVADNVAGSIYLVLQDSVPGSAFAARDSVGVDSVDNKVYRLHYTRRTGATHIRGLFRATAAATDSIHIAVFGIRACQRVPC